MRELRETVSEIVVAVLIWAALFGAAVFIMYEMGLTK